MEAEERPSKLRKIDHEGETNPASTTHGLNQDAVVPSSPTSTTTIKQLNNESHHAPDESSADIGEVEKIGRPISTVDNPPLSKNQLKKIKRREQWEAGRDYRKTRRKEKAQAKKFRKRESKKEGEVNGSASQTPQPPPKPQRHVKLPVAFVVDCGFDELMAEKERISLGSQLTRCYSDNTRAPYQGYLIVSSWGGLLKERFDTILHKQYRNWKHVQMISGDFVEAGDLAGKLMSSPRGVKFEGAFEQFAKDYPMVYSPANNRSRQSASSHSKLDTNTDTTETQPVTALTTELSSSAQDPASPPHAGQNQTTAPPTTLSNPTSTESPPIKNEIIYLTSDSPHTLTTLSPYTTYIIGGLVDKNRHKGICYKRALDNGIKTAKLPIGEYMKMQSRFVLATNHVLEILLRWLELGDWGEAFLRVIPKRKGGELKLDDNQPEEEGDNNGTEGGAEREDEEENEEEGQDDDDDEGGSDDDNEQFVVDGIELEDHHDKKSQYDENGDIDNLTAREDE